MRVKEMIEILSKLDDPEREVLIAVRVDTKVFPVCNASISGLSNFYKVKDNAIFSIYLPDGMSVVERGKKKNG